MKKGFLNKSRSTTKVPLPRTTQASDYAPLMFKLDFTIDSDNHLRIYELGHYFSSNIGGLEDSIFNLIKKLKERYSHVYISGDYPEIHYICENYSLITNEQPPEYVPIDELITIKTEHSIVLVRTMESPSYYTPYCIQEKLRKAGSSLTVFGAEPLACIMAYEKIIMQRLQIYTGMTYPIPSALINISSDQNIVSQLQQQMLTQYCPSWDNCMKFMIKPAFSSCGSGIQYAGPNSEAIKLLQTLQENHLSNTTNSYQRTAEDFIGVLFVGANAIKGLQERKRKIKEFVEKNKLDYLLENFHLEPNPDPFFIVQQTVFSACNLYKEERWLPTYRTFIFIEKDESSVKISLLSKIIMLHPKKPFNSEEIDTDSIVAGLATSEFCCEPIDSVKTTILNTLNNQKNREFFNEIFRGELRTISDKLIPAFPELKAYWSSILSYPPYLKMLSTRQDNSKIRKYENLVLVYKLQCLSLSTSKANNSSLEDLIFLFGLYKRISLEQDKFYSSLLFFKRIAEKLFKEINIHNIYASEKQRKNHLSVMLGMSMLITHLIEHGPKANQVTLIKTCLKEIAKIFSGAFPSIFHLISSHQESPENSLQKKIMQEKHSREIIIEYTCILCTLEKVLSKEGIQDEEVNTILQYQKSRFLSCSMFYFDAISTQYNQFSGATSCVATNLDPLKLRSCTSI